jgi:hypothetical protein
LELTKKQDIKTGEIHAYSIQVLTKYDAFRNQVLNHYFTKEYRRASGKNEEEAIRNAGEIGPHGTIGTVRRVF